MKPIKASQMFLVLLLVFSPIAASKEYSTIEDFVVSGVSLGDAADDVLAGLSKFYSISQDEFEITTEYEGDAIEYIEFQAKGQKVVAYLEPKEESDKNAKGKNQNVLVLLTIRHEPLIDDFEAYAKKWIKEYGAPSRTMGKAKRLSYQWCEKFDDKGYCDVDHLSFFIGSKDLFLGKN